MRLFTAAVRLSALLLLVGSGVACSGATSAGSSPPGTSPLPTGSGFATPSPQPSPTTSGSVPSPSPTGSSAGSPTPVPSGSPAPALDPHLVLSGGLHGATIAQVAGARQLAALPNGDLLVGTTSNAVVIVPGAEAAGVAGTPATFITLPEGSAQGVAYSPSGYVFVTTEHNVWRIPYHSGDLSEPSSSATSIALVRQGPIAPHSDGDVHHTTSVTVNGGTLYVGVGSSCNACTEVDPTRATIQQMSLDGSHMSTLAKRIRNPIALTINPVTGTLWAGGAGQDDLPYHHPYEYLDPVTLHATPVDYGWPVCEEDHNPYGSGADCSQTVAPRVEFPSYATLIGAAIYPVTPIGPYVLPSAYRGGAFVAWHGSWHCCPSTPPELAFVPMTGDTPATSVNWGDPTIQWQSVLTDTRDSIAFASYPVRFTGVSVGPSGSLFIGDDSAGAIYRIRP